MGATTGINAIGTYSAQGTLASQVDALMGLIPDPDSTSGSGAVGGGAQGKYNTYLDEMSPAAATAIRAELLALKAARVTSNGQYTVLAADDTANQVDIVTGLADLTLANSAVTIRRAGAVVGPATITEPVAGTLRVADNGGTYTLTTGDVITWFAK